MFEVFSFASVFENNVFQKKKHHRGTGIETHIDALSSKLKIHSILDPFCRAIGGLKIANSI